MQGKCVKVENLTASAHNKYSSVLYNMYNTLYFRKKFLQLLIVSLLALHINVIVVTTCSDNFIRRLVTCITSLFNSFHYHMTQFHCYNSASQYEEFFFVIKLCFR